MCAAHLHRDWAHTSHICTGTGLTPPTSAPGLGPPPSHICTVLGSLLRWASFGTTCIGSTASSSLSGPRRVLRRLGSHSGVPTHAHSHLTGASRTNAHYAAVDCAVRSNIPHAGATAQPLTLGSAPARLRLGLPWLGRTPQCLPAAVLRALHPHPRCGNTAHGGPRLPLHGAHERTGNQHVCVGT